MQKQNGCSVDSDTHQAEDKCSQTDIEYDREDGAQSWPDGSFRLPGVEPDSEDGEDEGAEHQVSEQDREDVGGADVLPHPIVEEEGQDGEKVDTKPQDGEDDSSNSHGIRISDCIDHGLILLQHHLTIITAGSFLPACCGWMGRGLHTNIQIFVNLTS